MTSSKGLKTDTYNGPFLSMHHDIRQNDSAEHTIPCTINNETFLVLGFDSYGLSDQLMLIRNYMTYRVDT